LIKFITIITIEVAYIVAPTSNALPERLSGLDANFPCKNSSLIPLISLSDNTDTDSDISFAIEVNDSQSAVEYN
jgi:hypothetical protein